MMVNALKLIRNQRQILLQIPIPIILSSLKMIRLLQRWKSLLTIQRVKANLSKLFD